MPKVTRWFVYSATVYLLLAVSLAVVRGAPALQQRLPAAFSSFAIYVHLWMLGWLTQLIYGIGFWLLPVVDRRRGRGAVWPLWMSFWCLNVGLPLRALTEAHVVRVGSFDAVHALYAVAGVLLWLSAVGFVANIWPRVR